MPELYPFILRVLGAEQSVHEEFVTHPLTTFKIIPFCRSHPRRLCVQISVALSQKNGFLNYHFMIYD